MSSAVLNLQRHFSCQAACSNIQEFTLVRNFIDVLRVTNHLLGKGTTAEFVKTCFFLNWRSLIFAAKHLTAEIKHDLEMPILCLFVIFYYFLNLN
jgi:hypothetical protein